VEPLPQPPPESPAKDVESEVPPGSLKRFRSLASRLFGVDRERFRDALSKDEKERAKRRALARSSHAPRSRKD
jgi:hypothetical protein